LYFYLDLSYRKQRKVARKNYDFSRLLTKLYESVKKKLFNLTTCFLDFIEIVSFKSPIVEDGLVRA